LTKSTGVGRGGKREGSGRKPAPSEKPTNQTDVAGLSAEEILAKAANLLFQAGQLDAASKAAKRLSDAQRQAGVKPGKKLQAQAAAAAGTAPGSRFAPPPPPRQH